MKRFTLLLLTLIMVLSFASFAFAGGFATCAGCHNGKIAPAKETLKEKYKTADELVKGAMAAKNAMMKNFQKEEVLQEAAKDGGWE